MTITAGGRPEYSPEDKITIVVNTPASLVERWNSLKAHLAAQTKAFSDYCKPFRDEQEQIEGKLLDFLNTNKLNNIKTEAGTAYKSTLTQPKIVDRDKYLDVCLDNWDDFGNELLQIGAPQIAAFELYMERRKVWLEAYVKENGQLPDDPSVTPPGTEVNYFTRVNIRKT